MAKRNWSKEWNALPDEARLIGSALEFQVRIQHLIAERDRLGIRYRQSCSEITAWIKACEQSLAKLDKAAGAEGGGQ